MNPGDRIIAKVMSRPALCRGGCTRQISKGQVALGFRVFPGDSRHLNWYCLECVETAAKNALPSCNKGGQEA